MLYSWLYVFINALSGLLRQVIGSVAPPSSVLLMGAIASILFFNILNIHRLKIIYQSCWENKSSWIVLGIAVAGLWLPAFYVPPMIGASLYTFIFFSLLGCLGKGMLYLKSPQKTKISLYSLIGLSGLLVTVILISLYLYPTQQEVEGIGLSIFGSIMGFIYAKQSAQFATKTHLSASSVLAVRFYLTIPISFVLLPAQDHLLFGSAHPIFVIAVAIFCLIVPAYFSQKGIEKAGPEMNAVIISVTPFFTAILQSLYFKNIAWPYFVIYSTYVFVATLPVSVDWFASRRQADLAQEVS